MYGPAKAVPLNMPHIQISSHTHGTTLSINISYELIAINNVTRSADVHTLHMTGTCL